MTLANIEPGETGYDLRTFERPRCKSFQRYVVESNVTQTWLADRTNWIFGKGWCPPATIKRPATVGSKMRAAHKPPFWFACSLPGEFA